MRLTRTIGIFTLICWLQIVPGGPGVAFGQQVFKQGPPVPANFCVNDSVLKLYRMINEYRKGYNLSPVPLSKSLCYVASLHAKDLLLHHPDRGGCNSYSWSDKSNLWKPFCYPRDENKKNSVWDKPRELTRYPSKAFEIVYWENTSLLTDTVMMVWRTEEFFNSFLINTGKWQGKTWNAIGISVFENYVCAWFGEVTDPEGNAYLCGAIPKKPLKDTVKTNVNTVIPGPKDSLIVTYYIIVKTNLSVKAAEELVSTFKSGDYPGARVIDQDSKIRVSVFESKDKPMAMAKLKEVKKKYKDAWLMKK